MYRRNKQFLFLIIFAAFFAIIFIGGAAIAKSENANDNSSNSKACTMEAKLCSDGKTYVGRSGPNCEFKECPGEDDDASPSPSSSASVSPSPSASPSGSVSASPSPTGNSTPKNKGQANAQEHRSVVANFVQSLVHLADRDGGIGEQVRLIAREQNEAASTTIQAMERVETRSKIKTFLIGSDYKNLGSLRSEMVQTRNRLTQLANLITKTENASSTEDIAKQITELEQEQVKIENFIKAQESRFSLFGWLVNFFSK